MSNYIKELKQAYLENKLSKAQYVQELLCKFYDNAKVKPGFQIRGIKSLLSLTKIKGLGSAIEKKDIHETAEFPPNYSHCGMWDSVRAGIVEKLKSPERYRIRPEFYEVIIQILNKSKW